MAFLSPLDSLILQAAFSWRTPATSFFPNRALSRWLISLTSLRPPTRDREAIAPPSRLIFRQRIAFSSARSGPSRSLNLRPQVRPYRRCYFPNTQAIISVVDSRDTDRLVIAKEEFHAILEEEELKGAVILIFANEQDLPRALDDAAITEALELYKIKSRQWAIFETSAIKGGAFLRDSTV